MTTTQQRSSCETGNPTTEEKRRRFEADARPHLELLHAKARRLARTEADADDLMQDTMVRAYRYYDRFEEGTNFKAWLFQIQRNAFVNQYRRKKRERAAVSEEVIPSIHGNCIGDATKRNGAEPEQNVERPMIARAIQDALNDLPEHARSVVVRADVDGWSYKEIAEDMGMPLGTVMSRLHRARKTLQGSLQEQAEQLGIVNEAVNLAA